jgi:hypothetical protein
MIKDHEKVLERIREFKYLKDYCFGIYGLNEGRDGRSRLGARLLGGGKEKLGGEEIGWLEGMGAIPVYEFWDMEGVGVTERRRWGFIGGYADALYRLPAYYLLDLILCGLLGPRVSKVYNGVGMGNGVMSNSVSLEIRPNPRAFVERREALGVKGLAFSVGGASQGASVFGGKDWGLFGVVDGDGITEGAEEHDLTRFVMYFGDGKAGYLAPVKLGFEELSLSATDQAVYLDFLSAYILENRELGCLSENTGQRYCAYLRATQRKYGLLEELTLADYVGFGEGE